MTAIYCIAILNIYRQFSTKKENHSPKNKNKYITLYIEIYFDLLGNLSN